MRLREALAVENHRGRRVPRTLGLALAVWVVLAGLVGWWAGSWDAAQLGIGGAAILVSLAGLVDDLVGGTVRGLRGHGRALLEGHVTTGAVKVLVVTACAVVAVALLGRGGTGSRVAAVITVAAATNAMNGLDVRPGRALKVFLLALLVSWVVHAWDPLLLILVLWPAALVALIVDLRERAMLGDAGANLLGFALGCQLVASVPADLVWVAALVTVGLNVVAETVTFSRVIEATRPLHWFDRLGRLPD